MPVLATIRDRFERSPAYVCEFCGTTYDSDRRNCHACGFDVVRQEDR